MMLFGSIDLLFSYQFQDSYYWTVIEGAQNTTLYLCLDELHTIRDSCKTKFLLRQPLYNWTQREKLLNIAVQL